MLHILQTGRQDLTPAKSSTPLAAVVWNQTVDLCEVWLHILEGHQRHGSQLGEGKAGFTEEAATEL